MVAALHVGASFTEPGPVAVEMVDGAAEPADDRADPVVDRREPVDHGPVVGDVAMIVVNFTGAHLPVVAHANKLDVTRQELFVRGPDRALRLAVLVIVEPKHGLRGGATRGREDQVLTARTRVARAYERGALLGGGVGDLAAQSELEQQRAVVHRLFVHGVNLGLAVGSAAMTDELGIGTTVFVATPVQGSWRMLQTPDDVLSLMDTGAEGVIAGVQDAGATFLAPIFDELAAVVCMSGTPSSHIGIVSREYRVPCIMATTFSASPPVDGMTIELDCTNDVGVVRSVG